MILEQCGPCRAELQSQAAPSVLEHRVAVFAVPKKWIPLTVTCLLDQYRPLKISHSSQQIMSTWKSQWGWIEQIRLIKCDERQSIKPWFFCVMPHIYLRIRVLPALKLVSRKCAGFVLNCVAKVWMIDICQPSQHAPLSPFGCTAGPDWYGQ